MDPNTDNTSAPQSEEQMATTLWDIIIAGGGIAGSVLATRLGQNNPGLQILLVEAGNNVSHHPLTSAPLDAFSEHFSELDWAYSTVPQSQLSNRNMYAAAGKALSGGSATNYGTWTRGNSADFDHWAALVGDPAWGYQGWLQYFKRTEDYYNGTGAAFTSQHGFNGPITAESVTSSDAKRKYPLRQPLSDAWDSVGVKPIDDGNNGHPIGRAELVEDFKNGTRQLASEAYGLGAVKNVRILTGTMVQKVLVDTVHGKKVATGIQIANGTKFRASKQVVVSTGAYRTPQVLQLSGIGPSALLKKYKIPVVLDAPEVGRNFHDHLATCQWWKVTKSGLALGSSELTDPAFFKGLPADWVITEQTPADKLTAALKADGQKVDGNPILGKDVAHTETLVVYAPAGAQLANVNVPMDGSHIASCVLVMNPTSRGSVNIAGPNVTTVPAIDPNYSHTNVDRVIMREGMRNVMRVLNSTAMAQYIDSETTPDGFAPLTADSSDADIDARVARVGNTFYHPAGSASMGKVVDTKLKVKGIDHLRVVDASVFPLPITAHYQASTYALSERAADLINGEIQGRDC